ncbi:MAG: 16S rRNA (cytosine(1402)-N(4))-methyltransferase RsmH [Bacteroidia bacterium]|nr:16S rRNA (cytosine(1402)-N(4))-methyltransferase RsmH [Bacteroidia bacterium]MDW8015785.1 16S rRNA (cytosine(1402)-N(4))-methyltransferase RsmH [Bacteroidia bacterium]
MESVVKTYHVPVLCDEAVEGLITDLDGIYVDATYGGGGHARAILKKLSGKGRLYAIDKDPAAPLSVLQDERFQGIRGDFRDIKELLARWEVERVHGILADLGVSWHQLDTPERGFSYRWIAPLDLRMNPSIGEPAWVWIGKQTISSLAKILRLYGNLPKSHRLAKAILKNWHSEFTTGELVACAEAVFGPKASHYSAPLFQAIRIAVNAELEALERLLRAAEALIVPGGRLVILTYHSGEARLVKAFIRTPYRWDPVTGHQQFQWRLLRKVRPSPTEVARNPRSRSAILWVAEKT